MGEKIGNGGSRGSSGELAELTRAVPSGKPVGTLPDYIPRKRVAAVMPMVKNNIQVADLTWDDATELSVEDQVVLAILEHRAMYSSQQALRSATKSPPRRDRPLGLDREEVQRASAGAPNYPHVVLDGDDLDGNALSLIGAVTSALREAGIPDDEVNAVFGEGHSGRLQSRPENPDRPGHHKVAGRCGPEDAGARPETQGLRHRRATPS